MNNNKELKAYWWAVFMILGIVFIFTSCNDDCDNLEEIPQKYASLKVENQLNDSWRSITGVSLVGYEFGSLNIEPHGDSQTFILDKGMSGGYEDINVTVKYIRYSGVRGSTSIKIDFNQGETTIIALTGCSGAEGCPGIYLEHKP